jgi:hypothetical protein
MASISKYRKTALELALRLANEQRISTVKISCRTCKIFCPTVFTIDGHEFTSLQFRVLPNFKSSDIILRLTALRELNVTIHPISNEFTLKNATVTCHREPILINCLLSRIR